MFGLPTPASTQVAQDTGPDPTQDTQVTRHATYYNTDVPDPIILQVENLLYCQSFHYIARHILVLQRMRNLPPPPEGHQGGSDDNPVCLPGASSSTFELILSILDLSIFSEARQSQLSQEKVLDILQFSDKWDARGVQDYCFNYLDRAVQTRELHPMLAFSIGRKFHRKAWLEEALTKLQRMPISTWIDNPTVLSWMSPHDMIVVLRLREHMHLSRLDLICFRPEASHTANCKNKEQCSFHWDLSWALSVVPRIAHKTYSPAEVFMFITGLEVAGMGEGCAKASRTAAIASNRFYVDLRGIEKALELI